MTSTTASYHSMLEDSVYNKTYLESLRRQMGIDFHRYPYLDLLKYRMSGFPMESYGLIVTEIVPATHAKDLYAEADYLIFMSENHRVNFLIQLHVVLGITKHKHCHALVVNPFTPMMPESIQTGMPAIIQPDSIEDFDLFLSLYRLFCAHSIEAVLFLCYSQEHLDALKSSAEPNINIKLVNMRVKNEVLSPTNRISMLFSLDAAPQSPIIEAQTNFANYKLNTFLSYHDDMLRAVFNPQSEQYQNYVRDSLQLHERSITR
jgi:hypothetical protein